MFRVITANLNGIRSAAKKGFFHWIRTENPDVICVQEVKAQEDILMDQAFALEGYHSHFHCALKKGYSGVGIYSKHSPALVKKGLGWIEADEEGRYIEAHIGPLVIVSLYMPSGTSGDVRQQVKFDFLKRYADHLHQFKDEKKYFMICGDFNIAHKAIDLKNWRSNQKNSGFLPEERAWMDHLFGPMDCVDAFRVMNANEEQYTWWSHRGQAWAKNVGWRIDYQVISPTLKERVKQVSIYKNERFSDHAPLIVDYDLENIL